MIVNTSSTSGFIGTVGLVAYTASKFAVRGMTKVAAMELGHFGIRVNSVHPGGIDTEMIKQPEFGDIDQTQAFRTQSIPHVGQTGRGRQARAVPRVRRLVSSRTGAEFLVDGGYTAGPPIFGLDAS